MTAVLIDLSVYAAANMERGIAHLRANRFKEAIAELDQVLQITPNDPYAHWNKATALLSLGDYPRGFVEHSWGWQLFNWRGFGPVKNDIDRLRLLPVWKGESAPRLLVYHELGFGDAIMCLRYLSELRQRSVLVTLVVDEPLARLMHGHGVEVVTRVPDELSGFDFRLPFFSVMQVLGETLETIPRGPYIGAKWKRAGGKMGIAWSGRTQQTFTALEFIASIGDWVYEIYSLQHAESVPAGVVRLRARDFADTVKLLEEMDHVVTVDTAVAHLAGAMGHPSAHLIIPFMSDWRWWHSEAWYPTLKVYRQLPTGEWPFAQVRRALS